DRRRPPGAELAAKLGREPPFAPADVISEGEVAAAVALAVERFGTLHVAVCCAGVGAAMRTVTRDGPMPLGLFSRVVEINLIGTFNVVRLAAAQMAKNTPDPEGERGVLVNTASAAAFDGQIGQAAYSASKAGVVGMTLPIARDLMDAGIRVNTIMPGLFNTPLLNGLPERVHAALSASVPCPKRLGEPPEYAALVEAMIS